MEENRQLTPDEWKKMTEENQQLIDDIEAVFKKHGVTRAQYMLQNKDAILLDQDYMVGTIEKMGLLELARVNCATKQAGYVNAVLAQQARAAMAERERLTVVKPGPILK